MIPQTENIEKEIENFLLEDGKFKPYKAYKGFDKDLKCRNTQFEIGGTYSKEFKEKPTLCTTDGFHYCDELENVFKHYSFQNMSNRFCEIEILAPFTKDHEKCVTTSFKILKEIPREEINERIYDETHQLKTIREFQTLFPYSHVGGSAGLFLHGVKLERHSGNAVSSSKYPRDLDMVMSFYTTSDDPRIQNEALKSSGNDFDETIIFDNVKIDLKVDPRQRYEIIEYKGFKYKVSLFETIMEAKFRYAALGNDKHADDVYEILGDKEHSLNTFNVMMKMLSRNNGYYFDPKKKKENDSFNTLLLSSVAPRYTNKR